jgi:hypothetical protein
MIEMAPFNLHLMDKIILIGVMYVSGTFVKPKMKGGYMKVNK